MATELLTIELYYRTENKNVGFHEKRDTVGNMYVNIAIAECISTSTSAGEITKIRGN